MRHCFEGCLARIFWAVLDCTSTTAETQMGAREETLGFSQPEETQCGPGRALCLQQRGGLPLAVPLHLAVRYCEENDCFLQFEQSVCTYYSYLKTFDSKNELV